MQFDHHGLMDGGTVKVLVRDFYWFHDKVTHFDKALAGVELYHRLKWLCEGSLSYRLSQFRYGQPSNHEEKELAAQFLTHCREVHNG